MQRHPEVMLNNTRQKFPHFTLFPKGEFDLGRPFGRCHSIHMNAGSWHPRPYDTKFRIALRKLMSMENPLFRDAQIIRTTFRRNSQSKRNIFYEYSLSQKKTGT